MSAKVVIGMMSLVCVTGLAAWTLIPSTRGCREPAGRVKCASNLAQIGRAIALYADENRGTYPSTPARLLMTQDLVPEVFVCPQTNLTPAPTCEAFVGNAADSSYIYVADGLTNLTTNDDVVLLIDRTDNHDGDGCHVLFADFHVEFMYWKRPTTRPSDAVPDPAWAAVQDQIDRNVRPVRWPRPAR